MRALKAEIGAEVDDLVDRIPLIEDRLRLLREVLAVQAEQSLSSAEAAYSAGTVGALDLLDAERVMFQVRVAEARAETDLAVALAELEGAVGMSLSRVREES